MVQDGCSRLNDIQAIITGLRELRATKRSVIGICQLIAEWSSAKYQWANKARRMCNQII